MTLLNRFLYKIIFYGWELSVISVTNRHKPSGAKGLANDTNTYVSVIEVSLMPKWAVRNRQEYW